jgi:hypothetical protein
MDKKFVAVVGADEAVRGVGIEKFDDADAPLR